MAKTGIILMVGIIVIGISMMAYYAFLERLAVQVGKQMLFEILCLVAESRSRIVAGNSVS